jgi:hypothetical protein
VARLEGDMLSTKSTSEEAESVATCLAAFKPGHCLSELRLLARAYQQLQPIQSEAEELVELLGPEPGLSVRGRLGRQLLALSDRFLDVAAELGLLGPQTVAELQSGPEDVDQMEVA